MSGLDSAAEGRTATAPARTAHVHEGRGGDALATLDRMAWRLFALAAAVAVALLLWLGRDRSYASDELVWFMQTSEGPLEPHNGHLILVSRVVYKAIFETIGVDYRTFTLLTVAMVVLTSGLFFAYAGRRVGKLVALAPTLVLLVFGADSSNVLSGIGSSVIGTVACGLGALLALDRDDRKGDIAASALLCIGVATFSPALAFVVGVAVSVLLRPDRWRRIWIVAIPVVLYGAWWLGFSNGSGQQVAIDDILLFPSWAFQSLSADLSSLAGVDYAFGDDIGQTTGAAGPALSLLALAALGWRLWRGRVQTMLWASLAIAAALWLLGTVASSDLRTPDSERYLFTGTVVVLVAAAWAAQGVRWNRPMVITLFLVAAAGVLTNVALLRDWGEIHRNETIETRTELAAIEIAGDQADPAYAPADPPTPIAFSFTGDHLSGAYLAAAERYGSIGYSVDELRGLGDFYRTDADTTLVGALGLALIPTDAGVPRGDCVKLGTADGASFELAPGSTVVLAADATAAVQVRRFASTGVDVGGVAAGQTVTLTVPVDQVGGPWQVTATAPVRACATS